MHQFAALAPADPNTSIRIGKFHLPQFACLISCLQTLRTTLIDAVTLREIENPPESVFGLIRAFLHRLSLPGLVHFIDHFLPQMVPVSFPSQTDARKFLGSQHVREWIEAEKGRVPVQIQVKAFPI